MSAHSPVAPARKGLIRTVRCLAKGTSVWIQGIIVWMTETQFAIDDGSGIARIPLQQYKKEDSASEVHRLRAGQYVMVVGIMVGKFKGHRMGIRPTTIRDLMSHGPMIEALWNLEVADAFLYTQEKRKLSNDTMDD